MCEYCGCQALTAIDDLTREHDLVVNLIGDVRAAHTAADTARMADLARQVSEILDLLREHILKAQDGVFPAALANLGTADWDAIDAIRTRVGTLLPVPGR
jgi:hemerythrin-like domain-containing protein